MSKSVLFNEAGTVAYVKDGSALFSLGFDKKTRPSSPVIKESVSNVYAPWGDDNLFPQNVIADVEKNSIIGSALKFQAETAYSGGLIYGIVDGYDNDGNEIFKPIIDPAIEYFLKTSNIRRYLIEAFNDFYYFINCFPELVLSKDRKQIVAISEVDAAYCRWQKQNPKTGLIEYCYINANWENPGDEKDWIKVPVIDPYFDPVEALRADTKGYKYIYPVSFPTPGKTYYQLAHWNAIRKSGWLDVAQAIPIFKKSLLKNQLTIKYHIKVPSFYWTDKYKDWEKKTDEKRQEIMKQEITAFNEFLKGGERAGMSIMTTFKFNEQTKIQYPGWIIEPIDDKLKDGAYIEDSQEASSHILFALGIDNTLIGSGPGKSMGAGSGSDKREAYNLYVTRVKVHQDLVLEPLHFIRDYNGWNPKIQFRMKNAFLQTLNKVTPEKRNNVNGTI